jgi:hypothetical protein
MIRAISVFPEYLKIKIILMENVYWTMKNGQKINVDTMDIQHLRNTLKLIINNKARVITTPVKPKFEIQGDIAQNFIEQMLEEDYAPEDYNDLY